VVKVVGNRRLANFGPVVVLSSFPASIKLSELVHFHDGGLNGVK
jgi:hypothetical protein